MEELLIGVGVVGGALALLYVASRRAITVAELAIERGKLRVARGGISPSVLADLEDVVERSSIREGRVRIVREGGRAGIEISGEVSPGDAQRIRNVVGRVPLAKLANARRRR